MLTLTGTASAADYQAFFQSVTYTSGTNPSPGTTRTIGFMVSDNVASSNLATKDIAITLHTAPVLANIEGTALAYDTGSGPAPVTSSITVTASDDTDLASATVSISAGYLAGQDSLSFTNTAAITGTFDASTGVLTLSGTDTVANYQAALRSVTFSTAASTPSGSRLVSFQVDDGQAVNHASNVVSRDVTVTHVLTPPVPQNQSASVLGNVGITVAAPGVLAGATEPDGDAISVTAVVSGSSAHGGTFDIAADGMYDYTPAPGYTGSDSFQFQLCDSTDLSVCATGTVNLTVSGEIWFVDASAPAGGNGQLASPFNCLTGTGCFSAVEDGAASHPKAGDSIFLYSGSYTGGLTLLSNQKLIGQGATSSLATIAGVTVPPNSDPLPSTGGASPTMASSAASTNGVNLASTNTLDGFDIANTTGFHIAGTSFGTLTVADVALSGTGGALNLATGTLAATFSSITSTSSPGAGITLSSSVAGTLTSTNGTTISGSTAQCVLVSGSTVNANFGNTSCSRGTDGISLQGNSSGIRSFGTLSVSANSGAGFFDNAGGTTDVTGATTITNPTGTGVEIENASTGAVTFAGVTVNKSSTAGTGVSLSGTDTGQTFSFGTLSVTTSNGTALTASGGGTIATSGGTISATGGSAIVVNGVAFSTGSTLASASASGGTTPGISLTGGSGDMTIAGGAIAGNSSSAAFLVSGGTVNFSYGGSITQANSQRAVDVEGATANTISLGGSVNGNSSTGVFLNNNTGATVSFSGALSLSTGTNTAFTATGGGTVSATGSGSTITTTTATALNVANTTIGSAGLVFQSISSNGANPGISLSSTGTSGGLVVTGTGTAGSGGTVQNSTGDGISLSSTTDPSFTDMLVENNGNTSPGGDGITGSNVNGLTLSSSTVSGNGTAANLSGQNNPTPDNDGLDFLGGLTGTVTISNSAVTNSADDGLQITDSSGQPQSDDHRQHVQRRRLGPDQQPRSAARRRGRGPGQWSDERDRKRHWLDVHKQPGLPVRLPTLDQFDGHRQRYQQHHIQQQHAEQPDRPG